MKVNETDSAKKYILKRGLYKQYKKAKTKIQKGQLSQVDFKKRKPLNENLYQFKINKRFRAFCVKNDKGLIVIRISDHQ